MLQPQIAQYLGHQLVVELDVVALEKLFQLGLALGDNLAPVLTQGGQESAAGFGGGDEVEPLLLGSLRLGGKNLDLVAAVQLLAQRYEAVVHLGGDAVEPQVGVQGEGQVEGRGILGQGDEVALGGEDKNLGTEEVELDGIEEVDGVGFGVLEYVLDGLEPDVELRLFVGVAYLVLPVGGETALGDFVHLLAAYLYLDPVAVGAHDGEVQGLVAVGLGAAHPVARALGMQLVDVGDD